MTISRIKCYYLMAISALCLVDPVASKEYQNFEQAKNVRLDKIGQYVSNHMTSDSKLKLLLLINESQRLVLRVNPPETFTFGYSGDNPRALFLEYVPKGQSVQSWSEIFTIIQIPLGNNLDDVYKGLLTRFESVVPNFWETSRVEEIEQENTSKNTYSFLMDYPSVSHQGKREMLGVKLIQAQNDIWMLQYTIRYDATDESKQYAENKQKITQQFMKNSVDELSAEEFAQFFPPKK